MAETIGRAYVRILADGSGLDESIRRQFDDADFDQYGRKASAEWLEGFKEEQAKRPNQVALRDALAAPLIRGRWLRNEFFKSKPWRDFQAGLKKEYGEAGRLAGERYEQGLLEGMDFDTLRKRLGNISPDLLRAQRELESQMVAQQRESLNEAYRMNREHNARRLADWQASIDDAEAKYRVHINNLARMDQARENSERQRITDQRRLLAKLREDFLLIGYDASRLMTGKTASGLRDVRRNIVELQQAMEAAGIENRVWTHTLADTDRELRRLHPRLNLIDNKVDSFATSLGRAFGYGARNNFVNAIGAMVRGIARLPRVLTGLTRLLSSPAGVAKLISGIGAAATGAFVAIGPLISGIAMLGGAIVALGSSTIMGAVAGLGALSGAGLGAAGAITTLVLAFQNATPEAKAAGREIKNVTKELGQVAARNVFANVTQQARQLGTVISGWSPTIRDIGQEISGIGDRWLDALDSPAYNRFRSDMHDFLPDAARSLGDILGNTLGGMGGLLRGMIPTTRVFFGWLEDVTGEFAKWANSKQGLIDIKNFMADASNSAARLGDLGGAVTDFFSELINLGNESGDNLLGSMTRTVEGWTRALQRNPGAVREWFNDVTDFARALGNAVRQVGRLAGALDTEFSRAAITAVFETITASARTLNTLLGPLARSFNNASSGTQAFVGQMAAAAIGFAGFSRIAGRAKTGVSNMAATMRDSSRRMSAFRGAAGAAAGVGGLMMLTSSAGSANTAVSTLGSAAGGALMGFSVGGPWGAAIGAGAGLLIGLATAAEDAGDGLRTFEIDAGNLTQTFDQVTGAITRSTRALISQRLQTSQPSLVRAATAIGISMRDLVGAVSGNEGAIRRVNAALAEGGNKWIRFANGGQATARSIVENVLPRLQNSFRRTHGDMEQIIEDSKTWKQALAGIPKEVFTKLRQENFDPSLRQIQRLRNQYDLTPKQVNTILKQTGYELNSRQLKNLTTDYRNLPPRVETRLDTLGWEASASQVAGLIQQYNLTPNQVITILRAQGADLSRRAVNNLRHDFRSLPERVETKLDAVGWEVTAGRIAGLAEQYRLTPRQVSTIVRATGLAETDRDVRALVREILNLDRKKANPKADVDTRGAEAAIRRLLGDLTGLDNKKPTPRADLNTAPANTAADQLLRALTNLGDKKPTPTADLNTGPFDTANQNLLGDILNLDQKRPQPSADLDSGPARTAIDGLNQLLTALGIRTVTPRVSVDTGGAVGSIQNVSSALSGLTDKTVTVTTNFVQSGNPNPGRATATGGIFGYAQNRLIGEAGPEAVVPLSRPLSQVDPAVRALSAIAQGLPMARGGVVGGGRTYNVEQHIYSPQTDSKAVATETINRLVAVGY